MKAALIYMVSLSVMVGGLAFAESEKPVQAASDGAEATQPLTATWASDTVCVYTRDAWTLKVTYLRKGSRSEGQDGQLLKEGVVVEGKTVGETKMTSLGKLKYYGSKRKRLWDLTGWNFSDRRHVKSAKLVPTQPSTEAKADLPEAKPPCCAGCAKK
jgi:hypothetical protein